VEARLSRRECGQSYYDTVSVAISLCCALEVAFKGAMFWRFGGLLWFRLLIAVGHVTEHLVEIVNGIVSEIIREKAGREPSERQLPMSPDVAARAPLPGQKRTGVQQTSSRAKAPREHAQYTGKKWQKFVDQWWF